MAKAPKASEAATEKTEATNVPTDETQAAAPAPWATQNAESSSEQATGAEAAPAVTPATDVDHVGVAGTGDDDKPPVNNAEQPVEETQQPNTADTVGSFLDFVNKQDGVQAPAEDEDDKPILPAEEQAASIDYEREAEDDAKVQTLLAQVEATVTEEELAQLRADVRNFILEKAPQYIERKHSLDMALTLVDGNNHFGTAAQDLPQHQKAEEDY